MFEQVVDDLTFIKLVVSNRQATDLMKMKKERNKFYKFSILLTSWIIEALIKEESFLQAMRHSCEEFASRGQIYGQTIYGFYTTIT